MHDVPVEPANGFPWVQIEQILVSSLICCQTPDVFLLFRFLLAVHMFCGVGGHPLDSLPCSMEGVWRAAKKICFFFFFPRNNRGLTG